MFLSSSTKQGGPSSFGRAFILQHFMNSNTPCTNRFPNNKLIHLLQKISSENCHSAFSSGPLFSFGISITEKKNTHTHTDDTKSTGRKKTQYHPLRRHVAHVAPSLFVCSSGGDASSIQSWSQFWTSGTQGLPSYWVDQLFGGKLVCVFFVPPKNNRE